MIYIQSNTERTFTHHFDCACALYGAIDNGYNYRLTSFEEVQSGKFDFLIKSNLFVGSTEFMREVFKRIGLTDVRLPVNSNRECEIISIAEAQDRCEKGDKLFIKPVEIKLFTGTVLDGFQYPFLDSLPKNTMVMAYKPFTKKIESEWRVYVKDGYIVDSRNYSGDFLIHPDYAYARDVIFANQVTFPCAYTIDIAVLVSGENVVVEFNDMWAIGNYGIPNDIYVNALKKRYFEIMKLKK